ncbi:chalcone isomerase family protein [Wenzhouxiangella sp. AB-CW3]|uniref:chalcone isomerase family protein n=1 Tax=Wenzhouxiangella sp. AB-CW3 TaxID=2771012 RepID=UPI00168A4C68|nr:chalcone isomerase family protein [Wenzhouxiangella sp. AB-CW3]QOC23338.1 chalcone isomerase family protein [Wenzhouxiangella sp. AB-CW3]
MYLLRTASRAGLLILLLTSMPAAADDADKLTQCAEVELRVAGLFNVGTARLYLAECKDAERILESIPKRFSLELARDMSGRDLIDSANDTLVDNLDLKSRDELPRDLACLANAYVDAERGERFDVVYEPETRLALYRNGDLLTECPDQGRGAEYFNIWFGERPFHHRLKNRLLDQSLSAAGSFQYSPYRWHILRTESV